MFKNFGAFWRLSVYWRLARHWRIFLKYRKVVGAWPNIFEPASYNERFQWRKIFDHDPAFVQLSDKIAAKKTFNAICPDLMVPTVLWEGHRAEDIPEEYFEPGFVIKVNHAAARNFFTTSWTHGDRKKLIAKINRAYRREFGKRKGEWAYSQITRKIFVEPEIGFGSDAPIIDFNFDVFSGTVFCAFVITNKERGPYKYGIFGPDGQRINTTVASMSDPSSRLPSDFVLPKVFDQAVDYAARLGKDYDQMRVDFSVKGDQFWGCEMTVYSTSGYANMFADPGLRKALNKQWDLRDSWFLKAEHTGWRKSYADHLRRCLDEQT